MTILESSASRQNPLGVLWQVLCCRPSLPTSSIETRSTGTRAETVGNEVILFFRNAQVTSAYLRSLLSAIMFQATTTSTDSSSGQTSYFYTLWFGKLQSSLWQVYIRDMLARDVQRELCFSNFRNYSTKRHRWLCVNREDASCNFKSSRLRSTAESMTKSTFSNCSSTFQTFHRLFPFVL